MQRRKSNANRYRCRECDYTFHSAHTWDDGSRCPECNEPAIERQ